MMEKTETRVHLEYKELQEQLERLVHLEAWAHQGKTVKTGLTECPCLDRRGHKALKVRRAILDLRDLRGYRALMAKTVSLDKQDLQDRKVHRVRRARRVCRVYKVYLAWTV